MKSTTFVLCVILALVSFPVLRGDDPKTGPKKLPPPAAGKIDFAKDVQPILERSCIRCHSTPEAVPTVNFRRNRGGLSLSTREDALKSGGVIGTVVVPGKSAQSPLVHLVAGYATGDVRAMPPSETARLSNEEIGKLRAWIDQGAVWPKEVVLTPPSTKAR